VLRGAAASHHAGHFASVYMHALGGTAMLFAGAAALSFAAARRIGRWHRWLGRAYLVAGGVGAGLGLALSISEPHPLPGVGLATGVLAATWLAVAAMGYRAARNRRFDQHRDWMVRSYVLTWTFVFCRIVMRTLPEADPATIVGIIWAAWIIPLVACEIALQWRAGAR